MANDSQMRAYVLNLGAMYSDPANIIAGAKTGRSVKDRPLDQLACNPSSAVLIRHPEAGWILFDTGLPDEPEKAWPREVAQQLVVQKPKETRMAQQLALAGIAPADVAAVISSHWHMDHIGNDHLFAKTADFYVGKAEAAHARRVVTQSDDPRDHGWYIREEVLQPRDRLHYIDADTELFPGVRVITLPGHSACVLGLVLSLGRKTLIFTSDAVYEHRNYDGLVPGVLYDEAAFIESLKKIHRIQQQCDAQVFFGHDAGQFYQDIKKAPDYYADSATS